MLDPAWWRRSYILLNGMVREDDLALQRSVYDYHLALVGNSGLTEDSFKGAQEHARETFYDILASMRPWEGTTKEARREKEYDELREKWKAAWGVDPSDPVWQEENARALKAWKEEQQKRKQEAEHGPEEELRARAAAKRHEVAMAQAALQRRRNQLLHGRR